jgi:phage gp36-like protein
MYCTLGDLKKQLSEQEIIRLVADSGTEPDLTHADDAGLAIVNAAISSASIEIDFAASARYPVPLTPIPARIVDICVEISIYNLFKRRFRDIPELIVKRYDDAKKELNEIAKGNRVLDITLPEGETKSGGFAINKTDSDRTYNLDGYM